MQIHSKSHKFNSEYLNQLSITLNFQFQTCAKKIKAP